MLYCTVLYIRILPNMGDQTHPWCFLGAGVPLWAVGHTPHCYLANLWLPIIYCGHCGIPFWTMLVLWDQQFLCYVVLDVRETNCETLCHAAFWIWEKPLEICWQNLCSLDVKWWTCCCVYFRRYVGNLWICCLRSHPCPLGKVTYLICTYMILYIVDWQFPEMSLWGRLD